MKFWFHSAPLWKIDVFPYLSIKTENGYALEKKGSRRKSEKIHP